MILVLIMMLQQLMIYQTFTQVFNEKEWHSVNKMFGFIKKMFVVVVSFFSRNALKCVLMNNQECRISPEIINANNNELSLYPYSIQVNKCNGCNNINDPYAKLCIPDAVKNINVKVFNRRSRANEKIHIKWHKTCKCKCRLDTSVCSDKQNWNKDKCRCECKELIDKRMCDNEFISNTSICECDKSCGIG